MLKNTIVVALMCMTASAQAGTDAGVSPSKVLTFKDWTVGCDNGLACQAVALVPEDAADKELSIVIKRPEGVAAPLNIELATGQSMSYGYGILVDGRTILNVGAQNTREFITVSGREALKLARSMSRGKVLEIIGDDFKKLGSASLSGTSAALRYIDAQQGRGGSAGAVVAIGKRKAAAKQAVLPVITAKKVVPTGLLPDATALVALSENSPCAADRFGSTQDIAYSLGTTAKGPQALVMLNCGAGAYNTTSGIYVGQQESTGKWTFAPARFDYGSYGFGEDKSIPLLVNSDWDAATQTISNYNKARGLGDCGSSETWVWDGSMFRLTSATAMRECRGSLEWIPVWRAEVKLTD
jgi:Protein of unknown function (DUF1176)